MGASSPQEGIRVLSFFRGSVPSASSFRVYIGGYRIQEGPAGLSGVGPVFISCWTRHVGIQVTLV